MSGPTETVRVGELEITVESSPVGLRMVIFDTTLKGDPAGLTAQVIFTRPEAFALAQAINRVL